MRDIGDKIATHAFEAYTLGDVLRQQQYLAVAVGCQAHLQSAVRIARRGCLDRAGIVGGANELDRLRIAKQVDQRLADVLGRFEAQQATGRIVEPSDTAIRVECNGGVGQRRGRCGIFVDEFVEALFPLCLTGRYERYTRIDVTPDPEMVRHGVDVALAQPVGQPLQVVQITQGVGEQRQQQERHHLIDKSARCHGNGEQEDDPPEFLDPSSARIQFVRTEKR